jgi:hydrogenase assembly chaperone HypC/HupF
MCIAFPARVLELDGADAVVEVDGGIRRASMLRGPEIEIDDWVLVAAGTVVRRLDPDEAIELERVIRAAVALTNAEPAAGPGGSR